MNLFDLWGPPFLLLYWVLGGSAIGAVVLVRRWAESGPVPRLEAVDPYVIAYLRSGAMEASRLAVMSLIDRGLLNMEGLRVAAEEGAKDKVRRPLERALLEIPGVRIVPSNLIQMKGVRDAAQAIGDKLRAQRLIPSRHQVFVRVVLGLVAVAILWGVASHKLDLAAARGHTNVGFLHMSRLGFPIVVAVVLARRRTAIGDRLLADLQELFRALRNRAAALPVGGATNEAALVAAAFGFAAVSVVGTWGAAPLLFPARTGSGGSADSSSSSCGSSCGGGGGCGGCGGCGG